VKYKATADKRRRPSEFEEGDFVWVVLTKDRFPSHIKTLDVFNIKHLVPFIDDSSEEDANSRANSLQGG
jgi:hypothetical protein